MQMLPPRHTCCVASRASGRPHHLAQGARGRPQDRMPTGGTGAASGTQALLSNKRLWRKRNTGSSDSCPRNCRSLVPGWHWPDKKVFGTNIFKKCSSESNGQSLATRFIPKDEDGQTSLRGLCFPANLLRATKLIQGVTTLPMSTPHSGVYALIFFF